jgi:hypothetical protein
MKRPTAAVWVFISYAVVILAAVTACVDTTLVVNFGPFPSAEVAGHAETEVDWLDPQSENATACTESFAALELQKYLRQITGRTNDFSIVSTASVPRGELLLIGGPASNATTRQLAGELGVDAAKLTAVGNEEMSASNRHAKRLKPFQMASITAQRILV